MARTARYWRINYLVACACLVHLVWAVLLLFSAAPLGTTPMAESPFASSQYLVAGVYFVAALLAFLPLWFSWIDGSRRGLWCCLPQQFLMMLSAGTSIKCVIRGAYADGTVRPWEFILAGEAWVIAGAVAHTMALLDWFWFSRRDV